MNLDASDQVHGAPVVDHLSSGVFDDSHLAEGTRFGQDLSPKHPGRALDTGEMGAFDWDLATGSILWTDSHYRIFGCASDVPVTFEFWKRHVHAEDVTKVLEVTERAKAGRAPWSCEYRILRPDGQTRWVSVRGHFEYAGNGTPVRGRGVVFDITQKKEWEKSLKESEERFKFLVEAIPALVWAADPDGTSNYYSDRFLRYLGKRRDEMTGWAWVQTLHPDDREQAAQAWATAVRTEGEYRATFRIREAASGTFRWFEAHAVPRRGENGKVQRWFGTCTDVHDRKLAENALRESELIARTHLAELQTLYSAAAVGMGFVTPDFKFARVNEALAQMNGISAREHIGKSVAEVIGPELWSRVEPLYRRVLAGERFTNLEVDGSIPGDPDTQRSWLIGYHPVRAEGNEVIGIGISVQEVTDQKRAQEQVKAALKKADHRQRLLQAVMAALPVGVAITDQAGGVSEINDGFKQVWGGTPPPAREVADYALYKAWSLETGAPILPDEWASAIATRNGHTVLGQLLEIQGFDGTRRSVINNAAPIFNGEGEIIGSAVAIMDITEMKRREQEAQARAEELTALMDAVPAVTFIAHDAKCLRITCSRATRELLRVGNHANVSMSAPQAERPASFRILKDGVDLPPEEMPIQLAVSRGLEVRNYEWTLALSDGSTRQLFGNAVPLFDKENHVRGAVGAFVDITERKLANEALAASEARLRLAQEAAQLGVHDWDVTTGRICWDARTREIWGVDPDKPITYDFFKETLHPDDEAITRAVVDKALDPAGDGKYYAEYRVWNRADGTFRWVAATGQVMFKEKRAVRLVGTVQDITQRKQFQAELERIVAERTASLREAVAQMEEFSYTISHDLRAPLRAMRTYAECLLESFGESLAPEARNYVERINANAVRLDKMFLEVLTYTRLGRSEICLERIDLNVLVKQVLEHYPAMTRPEVDIQIDSLPAVFGNEALLEQVLSNLLNNALKFVVPNRNPKIRVRAEVQPQSVRVWVEDNGIGIDPRYQQKLFHMFERLHPNLGYEGTGVGLAIVRKAMDKMGGKVGVNSDGKTGSQFWIELRSAL